MQQAVIQLYSNGFTYGGLPEKSRPVPPSCGLKPAFPIKHNTTMTGAVQSRAAVSMRISWCGFMFLARAGVGRDAVRPFGSRSGGG
jgi:hypothetical protein